jgi:aldose sugar dehydrogenase
MLRQAFGQLRRGARRSAAVVCAGAAVVSESATQASPQATPDTARTWVFESVAARIRVDVVAEGLMVPWGMAFLPDGRLLVSERPTGRLSVADLGTGVTVPVQGVPAVHGKEDGGLLDVVLHPRYRENGWIYFSYAIHTPEGNTTVVDRARLRGTRLVDRQRLFTAQPYIDNSNHFGSRLVLHEGYLFVSLGERDLRDLAQDLGTHHGKIVRLHEDGRVPDDNPFVRRAGARPEIWSYGHRNPQGLAVNPSTGELWEHEHGPKGGDEVNVIHPGGNYGWPVITYGREYEGGLVGAGLTERKGLQQPLYYYVPSIAPSGMEFYTGDAFPKWRGNLFIGAMALRHLNRLVIETGRVVREERLFADRRWRVRVVRQGPDGLLYIGVDDGRILRLRPER